jgi:hypothetical protein
MPAGKKDAGAESEGRIDRPTSLTSEAVFVPDARSVSLLVYFMSHCRPTAPQDIADLMDWPRDLPCGTAYDAEPKDTICRRFFELPLHMRLECEARFALKSAIAHVRVLAEHNGIPADVAEKLLRVDRIVIESDPPHA